ncbi:hypothetical protein ISF_01961 [Cordyceps fumosorosea ARSEF 2679]|uniref:Uncharacterized protein n=1 Tax=Cordyceps fumosorosea (strain ARSEF 2679) TaxID=1081104 RepID=A0A168CIB0_CORFA|nr:hypothetical protein ISF_01961 [Cordyceps fumosorosea ARSEF 2679]OAA71410.1 hypothetical protein ISF_01961 [Cordyceps fumosorosea ARSEF 2679]
MSGLMSLANGMVDTVKGMLDNYTLVIDGAHSTGLMCLMGPHGSGYTRPLGPENEYLIQVQANSKGLVPAETQQSSRLFAAQIPTSRPDKALPQPRIATRGLGLYARSRRAEATNSLLIESASETHSCHPVDDGRWAVNIAQ